jgi:hypothetical protein
LVAVAMHMLQPAEVVEQVKLVFHVLDKMELHL